MVALDTVRMGCEPKKKNHSSKGGFRSMEHKEKLNHLLPPAPCFLQKRTWLNTKQDLGLQDWKELQGNKVAEQRLHLR